MDRGRTEREYNGHTRGNSLMHVVLLMALLTMLFSGYMIILRYNMEAALNSRCYMETRLPPKTAHRSFCEAVSNGEPPAMNLIRQSFQGDCGRLREEFDETMDEEGVKEGKDGELKTEVSSLEEGMDAEEDMTTEKNAAVEGDMAAEEEIRWERYLYHALGNKEYVVRGKGASEDSGVIDDDMMRAPAADSPTAIDITLTAQPLKSLATVHTWVVSSGYSFSLMVDTIFDGRDGSVVVIHESYRSNRGDGPEVEVYLNRDGVYHYYEGSQP